MVGYVLCLIMYDGQLFGLHHDVNVALHLLNLDSSSSLLIHSAIIRRPRV